MGTIRLALLGAVASAALLSNAASAQDSTDWSGFYAGVFAGYGLDTAPASSSVTDPVTIEVNPGEFLTFGGSSSSTRFDTLLGGIQAGYNHQISNFVLGVEGTVGLGGWGKTNASTLTYNVVAGADFLNLSTNDRSDFSVDWLTMFAGRFGADFDGWLVYGKAGVAVANVSSQSVSSTTLDTNVAGVPFANGTYDSSAAYSALRAGMVVGAGLEKMLNDNVSVGLEYNYVNLGNVEVPSAGGLGGLLGGGNGSQTFSSNLHTVKASLNYHF